MINVSQKDITTLRTLAKKYAEYASLPIQDEKRRLWKSLNSLNMEKPMVAIDQLPWGQLDVDGSLVCVVENPEFRAVEWDLRTQIYKWEHLPADMVLNPYIELNLPFMDTGYGVEVKCHRMLSEEGSGVYAQHFDNVYNDYEDIEKIKDPILSIDREYEKELFDTACEIFRGILPVKYRGYIMHLGVWDDISQKMGVENVYIELMDRPEFIHAIMERYTNAVLSRIIQANELRLYDTACNLCHCSYTFMDGDENKTPVTGDGWAFGLAQLFTSVSPSIMDEFEVPYMQKLFPHFKNIYYGCCDRLDDRLDIVDKMPNIRKISCSPWSDRENFASKIDNKKYIMSNKPTPAILARTSFDEDAAREDIRRTIKAARENNVCLELIMKDVSTVRNEPQRLWRWAQIAVEETMRTSE